MPYTIDRFEDNDLAVLETDDGTSLNVPRLQIPSNANEGDVLIELSEDEIDGEVQFAVDAKATEQRRREISDLRASLPTVDDGDLEL